MSGVAPPTPQPPTLFSALDLPTDFHSLQNAYWQAEQEWERLRLAYEVVLADMLKRNEAAA